MTPIDIVLLTYQRKTLTENTIRYLCERTKYPYRLFVVDNHSTDGTQELLEKLEKEGTLFHWIEMSKNVGVHMGWNSAIGITTSPYVITTDNDCYVPDVDLDWLSQLVKFMDDRPEYGAIALQPHVFLGRSDPLPDSSGVIEVGHCGAVMRLMRRRAVLMAGGWDNHFDATRNHEETTICSRLHAVGYKTGYCSYLRCYHDFGGDNNWGYKDIPPHEHGHRIPGTEIWPTPEIFDKQKDQFDSKTWERK